MTRGTLAFPVALLLALVAAGGAQAAVELPVAVGTGHTSSSNLAVSALGDATCRSFSPTRVCAAVAVLGRAAAMCHGAQACAVASVAGDAAATCFSPTRLCLAASALGDATMRCSPWLLDAACVAASGAGDATTDCRALVTACAAASVLGDSRSDVAVSGAGHAEGAVLAVGPCRASGPLAVALGACLP